MTARGADVAGFREAIRRAGFESPDAPAPMGPARRGFDQPMRYAFFAGGGRSCGHLHGTVAGAVACVVAGRRQGQRGVVKAVQSDGSHPHRYLTDAEALEYRDAFGAAIREGGE